MNVELLAEEKFKCMQNKGRQELDGYVKDIIAVLNAYENQDALFSCQGQGMDGYSALANFLDIAKKLRVMLQLNKDKEELNIINEIQKQTDDRINADL